MFNFFIEVSLVDDLIDVFCCIIVWGVYLGELVCIFFFILCNGVEWCSMVCYIVDVYGYVDVSMNLVIDGDYYGIDFMGLLWLQKLV